MSYSLKDKIEITPDFVAELVAKSWQEVEHLQQQVANIDTESYLGMETTKLLKNLCTSYYVLIGCLENLVENPPAGIVAATAESPTEIPVKAEVTNNNAQRLDDIELADEVEAQQNTNFEPFEYFVDFDEPVGEPLSDEELYGS